MLLQEPMLPPVVLLAAPPHLVRDHLQDWLATALPRIRVVTASAPSPARRLAGAVYPRLALVDIDTPSAPGFELMHSLRRDLRQTLIIALSTYDAARFANRAREAGAIACVSPQELNGNFATLLRSLLEHPARMAS